MAKKELEPIKPRRLQKVKSFPICQLFGLSPNDWSDITIREEDMPEFIRTVHHKLIEMLSEAVKMGDAPEIHLNYSPCDPDEYTEFSLNVHYEEAESDKDLQKRIKRREYNKAYREQRKNRFRNYVLGSDSMS